jgi:superfamily II DNA or RNA helicase
MRLVVRDKLYIPIMEVEDEVVDWVKENFSFRMYNEQGCRVCPYKVDRYGYECNGCENNLGHFKFYAFTKNGKYLAVDLGNRKLLSQLLAKLGEYDLHDSRPVPLFNNPLRFNHKIAFDYQTKAIADVSEKGYGVLESAPRTGKTVMGAGIVITIGYKTLIVAHQEDLLEQFYNTFMSIDTEVVFTNCHKHEDSVGICKKYEDFERYDVCLATYQTFISPSGAKLLHRIRNMFGTVLVDEVHRAGADRYSEIISYFNSKVRLGMTATYDRKDGKHKVVSYVFGAIVHSTPAESLVPVVQAHDTGVSCTKHYKIWQYAMRFLETNVQRNRFILKYIKEDVKAGRSIIIPVTSHRMVNTLVPAINKICGIGTAMGWHGKLSKPDRRHILNLARSGEIRVVVAILPMAS